ncbi:MAG: multiheme c-type cytochrome [Bryobacteraceae bacterium]
MGHLTALLLAFAASPGCASCHPAEAAGFAGTGMGRSLGRPDPREYPTRSFPHGESTRLRVRRRGAELIHGVEQGRRVVEAPVQYFVGSGKQGRSYLTLLDGFLYQSPISYYAKTREWRLSPGYEDDARPDFSRPVTAECLFCHAGEASPVAGTQNRYQTPSFVEESIGCGRCHGDPAAHVAKPARGNIVNPGRLDAARRDSVCEQCHLSGEARIPNPGKSVWDYRPGAALESTFTVYVAGAGKPKVVSHAEQLATSRCAAESGGKMWCGACHDPHRWPANAAAWYRERCLTCHAGTLAATHQEPDADCAGCHMPARGPSDVPHTAFTDHRILARPATAAPGQRVERLRAWRLPEAGLAARNLGLAYVSAGESNQSAFQLNEGFRLLAELDGGLANDADVQTALGLILLRKNLPGEAAKSLERAVRLRPRDALRRMNLAAALAASGGAEAAVEELESAIARDPALEEAWALLERIHKESGAAEKARAVRERWRRESPLGKLEAGR